MQADRHARIRERAYQIWLAEGRVEGRQDEHWRRAEREIAGEEARTPAPANPGAGPVRARRSRATPPPAAPKPKAPRRARPAAPKK